MYSCVSRWIAILFWLLPRQLWDCDHPYSNKVCMELKGPRGKQMAFAKGYKNSSSSFWCPAQSFLDTQLQQGFHLCQPEASEKPLWQKPLAGTCYFWILSSSAGMVLELHYVAWISVRPCSICYCTYFFSLKKRNCFHLPFPISIWRQACQGA